MLTGQLYEIRDCINRKGRGMFASCNIKKGQLIMFEHPLITLYFYRHVIKWSKEIADALDRVVDTSGHATHEASSDLKSDGAAQTSLPTASKPTTSQPTDSKPTTSKDASKKPRKLISKVTQAFASKANRHYEHHYENDASVEVTEALRDDTGDAQDIKTATQVPTLSLGEEFDYKEDDDTQTLVRKRLIADFNDLCKFSPTDADALKRLQNDPEYRYGGDWLLRLWQRFSRETPSPGSINPELLELDLDQKVMSDVQTTPAHCRSLYQDICYINHSCLYNAQLIYRYDAGACYGWLYAVVDILRNDEITLFYEKDDRVKRRGASGMTSDVESAFGFDCGCEPCLGGYKDRESWEARY
ncbi:hypothetical protein DL98DRAFT_635311 [Cadophora sp. DSE1049]|nr:hypothetical protein DL98DRAFT_635311 [Cadophora sp. DSE1049]